MSLQFRTLSLVVSSVALLLSTAGGRYRSTSELPARSAPICCFAPIALTNTALQVHQML